jgi:hypothetical protein
MTQEELAAASSSIGSTLLTIVQDLLWVVLAFM